MLVCSGLRGFTNGRAFPAPSNLRRGGLQSSAKMGGANARQLTPNSEDPSPLSRPVSIWRKLYFLYVRSIKGRSAVAPTQSGARQAGRDGRALSSDVIGTDRMPGRALLGVPGPGTWRHRADVAQVGQDLPHDRQARPGRLRPTLSPDAVLIGRHMANDSAFLMGALRQRSICKAVHRSNQGLGDGHRRHHTVSVRAIAALVGNFSEVNCGRQIAARVARVPRQMRVSTFAVLANARSGGDFF